MIKKREKQQVVVGCGHSACRLCPATKAPVTSTRLLCWLGALGFPRIGCGDNIPGWSQRRISSRPQKSSASISAVFSRLKEREVMTEVQFLRRRLKQAMAAST